MLDPRYIEENLEALRHRLQHRCDLTLLDEFIQQNADRKKTLRKVEDLRHQRNFVSEEIASLKKAKQDASDKIAMMRQVNKQLKELEGELREIEQHFSELLYKIPNVPSGDVPLGADEGSNLELRRWGEPRRFDFDVKDHVELGKALDILDMERAAKLAGARFALYKGMGAMLERGLINFFLHVHTTEHGYTEVLPPFLANYESMFGTGQIPKLEGDMFKTIDPEYYLIPTAEVPLTNIHRDEILLEDDLPIKYCAYTPCFRREAGSYGKDVKGLIRQHQFNKVELVKLAHPDYSFDELESLTADAEDILQRLDLPYRVVVLASGDMGFSAAKTYDLEVWIPSQNRYREISSCSNFTDFQARRCMMRFRPSNGRKTELVHTLNGSGLAVGRTFVAILENYQQEDGSVVIPKALRPFVGGREIIAKP